MFFFIMLFIPTSSYFVLQFCNCIIFLCVCFFLVNNNNNKYRAAFQPSLGF